MIIFDPLLLPIVSITYSPLRQYPCHHHCRHHRRQLSHRKQTCWAARWCRSSFNQEIERKNRTQPLSIYFWSKLHASNICLNRIKYICKRWDSEQKCCGGIKVYTPAALALTGPLGETWAGISFLLLPQQTSLWRRFLGIDSSEIKKMPKILGNQLQPPLLGWKPINNRTSYERTDAFPSVHLLLDIIFLCKYNICFLKILSLLEETRSPKLDLCPLNFWSSCCPCFTKRCLLSVSF